MKKKILNIAAAIAGVFFAAVLLFVLVAFGPFIYNYHLSPLVRLEKSIDIGQDYDSVKVLCTRYYEEYRNEDEVYIDFVNTKDTPPEKFAPGWRKYIHMSHWIFMDDLQLWIYFDENDKVVDKDFLGD